MALGMERRNFVEGCTEKLLSTPLYFVAFCSGCPVQVERYNLDSHLAECEYRNRECPHGCGYSILRAEDAQHSCVAELRTELELLR